MIVDISLEEVENIAFLGLVLVDVLKQELLTSMRMQIGMTALVSNHNSLRFTTSKLDKKRVLTLIR